MRLARESDRIVISGRTDSVGPEEFNQQLALARAMAVRNFIRDAVPDLPNVIAIDAKGRCCFIASNDDEGGRSRNRPVEVVFTSSGVM
jgi:outer membrane protein OmpA-like peptidoglycan-associated protein